MGAPGLVTPFKAWVGTLPRSEYFHMRECTDLYAACMVDALHWLASKVAQQDNVFKENKDLKYTDFIEKERLLLFFYW